MNQQKQASNDEGLIAFCFMIGGAVLIYILGG